MKEITIFVFFINFFIFIIAMLKIKNTNYVKKYFLIVTFSIILWTLAEVFLSFNRIFVLIITSYALGSLAITNSLLFVANFVNQKDIQKKYLIIISILGIIIFSLCFIPNAFFIENNNDVQYTILFNLYSLYLLACLIFIIVSLSKKLKKLQNGKRTQVKYILLGFLCFGGLSLLTSFIFPIFKIYYFLNIDVINSMLLVLFIFYALISETIQDREKLRQEMKIAQIIQTSLLPKFGDKYNDLEIIAYMKPCEEVGGDYYDIAYDKQQNLWLAIGDVTGHGVTAGLIAMMAQSTFISNLDKNTEPINVFRNMNRVLHENIRIRLGETHFMTMMLLKYMENGKFLVTGAHPDIIIYRSKTKKWERVYIKGIYLGIINEERVVMMQKEIQLEKDDIMVLYTDGIIESVNEQKDCFGYEGIGKILVENADRKIIEIRDKIITSCLNWCNHEQEDDITMIIVKRS